MDPKTSKEKVYSKVLPAAVQLDFKLGHMRWTVTQLSRKAGISRPLIYYYFGKSKSGILLEAVRLLGSELAGFNEGKMEFWRKGQIANALLESRELLFRHPHFTAFYFAHRMDATEIGNAMRELEVDYKEKLASFFPWFGQEELEALFGLLMGVSFSPGLSNDAVIKAVKWVEQALQFSR